VATAYAQRCNWCGWDDKREILDNCPDCGSGEHMMDLSKLVIPCCGKCGQELNTDENTTLLNLGHDHKCSQDSMSWGELAELTHATQVERFNWCGCEDNEGNENPYADCPKV